MTINIVNIKTLFIIIGTTYTSLTSGKKIWARCYKLREFAANYTIAAVVYGLYWFAGTARFAIKLQYLPVNYSKMLNY